MVLLTLFFNCYQEEKLDVIAMAKKTPKMHYLYNGKMQPLTEIYKQNKKRRGGSKYLLSAIVSSIMARKD